MTKRRTFGAVLLGGLGLASAIASCDTGGVVGGECRPEFLCNGVCVDLDQDAENCGRCGDPCATGLICDDGECKAPGTGGANGQGGVFGSGGVAGGSSSGGAAGQGGEGRGGAGDGSGGSGAGFSSGGAGSDVCLPPFDKPWQCGDCDTECPPNEPLCSPSDTGFECVEACPDPLTQCADQCVDTNTHPLHCGRCNHACPSGICEDGKCVGVSPGHVVVICMSYEQVFAESAQVTLLGNVVFHRRSDPLRILAYGQYAKSNVRSQVNRAIGWASAGRAFNIDMLNSAPAVSDALDIASYDVLLVYDQPNAPAGVLADAGSLWADVLDEFAGAGGVVIVMSSGSGTSEMDELVTGAGLLPVSDETDFSFQVAYTRAPADIVGANVVTPFVALYQSCTMTTSATPDAETVFVVTDTAPGDGTGNPVVVHRIIEP